MFILHIINETLKYDICINFVIKIILMNINIDYEMIFFRLL